MRRYIVALFLAGLATAAPAAALPNERAVVGWPPMSLTFSGKYLAYSKSTAARIAAGGYTIHRTDTFRLRLIGTRFWGRQVEGMVLRTSAGRTTAGPMAGDETGRYVIAATGRNFPPQVVFCCRPDTRDLPVEASGRLDGPMAKAVTLDGPLVRYVLGDPDGGARLVSYHVAEGPGEPFSTRTSRPIPGDVNHALVAMAPGIVGWVDRATPQSVHLAATEPGAFEPFPGPVIAQEGRVLRLHVTRSMFVTLLRLPSGYRLVRHDAPDWLPQVIWSGRTPPGPTAAGDRTVVLVAGGVVQQVVPGARRRGIYRLKGGGAAIATDGNRVAVIERRKVRVRRKVMKRSVIVVVPVRNPPGPYVTSRAGS